MYFQIKNCHECYLQTIGQHICLQTRKLIKILKISKARRIYVRHQKLLV